MKAKTVLIADDDRALARALALRCSTLGLQTRTFDNGIDAYRSIASDAPDLLILDVNMPAANGLYLCDELALENALPRPPTIILTGLADAGTINKCRRIGAHYVWKGLDTWGELRGLICRLLELKDESIPAAEPETCSRAGC